MKCKDCGTSLGKDEVVCKKCGASNPLEAISIPKTIEELLAQIPEPKVKAPTKICSNYNPDSKGKCDYWRDGRCNATMHSRASVERLGEDYFCPHMPNYHKDKKKSLMKKEISKKYWTTYWEEKQKKVK